MSIYYPDKVEITNVTRDTTYRNETEGTPFISKAYVEDESSVRRGPLGSVNKPGVFIFLPKNMPIEKDDYIRVTKLHGVIIHPEDPAGVRRKVAKAEKVGSFSNSHIEVECESGS